MFAVRNRLHEASQHTVIKTSLLVHFVHLEFEIILCIRLLIMGNSENVRRTQKKAWVRRYSPLREG